MKTLAIGLLALTMSSTVLVSNLYDRVGQRLESQPDLAAILGKPTPELQNLRWMTGRWTVTARVFSSPNDIDRGTSVVTPILGGTWLQIQDRYAADPDDLGFLTYNPATKRWTAIGIDKSGNAVTSIGNWEGTRLVLIAENANILGERVTLRQTMEKRSEREYRVLNEERLPDGTWAAIDEYVYTKERRVSPAE